MPSQDTTRMESSKNMSSLARRLSSSSHLVHSAELERKVGNAVDVPVPVFIELYCLFNMVGVQSGG